MPRKSVDKGPPYPPLSTQWPAGICLAGSASFHQMANTKWCSLWNPKNVDRTEVERTEITREQGVEGHGNAGELIKEHRVPARQLLSIWVIMCTVESLVNKYESYIQKSLGGRFVNILSTMWWLIFGEMDMLITLIWSLHSVHLSWNQHCSLKYVQLLSVQMKWNVKFN